jgi:trk system potassium uptake protein TrkH
VTARLHPAVALVGSFGSAIVAGTLVLRLPVSANGPPVTLLEALFTATSAVCVTGLTVVDTGTRFSTFGQVVILLLIQAGGLGIMTFALFFSLLLGRRFSFSDHQLLRDTLHHSPTSELRSLLRYVLPFTFLVEGFGALVLWLRWRGEMPDAAYVAVFHGVSAFCNAGFSLFGENLVPFRGDPAVNLAVTLLIIVGGLGFLVNMELRAQIVARVRRRRPPPLSLQAKVVLATTAALLAGGMLLVLVLEWSNLLRGVPLGEKLWAAWFHSVNPRTAGFNTLDYGRATAPTLFFTILLMFVGGSPGSTAGGIKTTTFGLLVALARSRWRGVTRPMLFHRTVPEPVISRALSVTLLSWLIVSAALMALTVVEQGVRPFDAAPVGFLALMFEAASAFCTVGLSTGITSRISGTGQAILIVLMFVGRVGPLTVALAAGRRRPGARFEYAEENVMVG